MEYSTPSIVAPIGGVCSPSSLGGVAPSQCPPPSLHTAHYGQEAEMMGEEEEEDDMSRYLLPRPSKRARTNHWNEGARYVNNQYQHMAQYNNNLVHTPVKVRYIILENTVVYEYCIDYTDCRRNGCIQLSHSKVTTRPSCLLITLPRHPHLLRSTVAPRHTLYTVSREGVVLYCDVSIVTSE